MSTSRKKLRYKITVIGDGRVGKTSLISKYTLGAFDTDYVETMSKQLGRSFLNMIKKSMEIT